MEAIIQHIYNYFVGRGVNHLFTPFQYGNNCCCLNDPITTIFVNTGAENKSLFESH